MQETTRQTAVEAVNKHDFLFLIAGTRNEDGTYETQRIIEGKTCDLALPLAMALKDAPSIEKCVCKIRVQEKSPKCCTNWRMFFHRTLNRIKRKEKTKMTETANTTIPAGYMKDAAGRLVPESIVKPTEKLEDQLVTKIMDFACALSDQISRFKGHTGDDIAAYLSLIDEKYGVKKGGRKGNMTFQTYDGLKKVQVAISENIVFGAELQTAKTLIDECINEWGADSRPEIVTLIDHAFQVDKEGKINRNALLSLRRLDIKDETWQRAMQAITDSIRIDGSKLYYRFYERETAESPWRAVTVDLAKA